MNRILLSHDKKGFEKALRLINADLSAFNSLVKVIRENTDKVEISKNNVSALVEDPKGFLFDLVVAGKSLNFNGLPISRKKAIDLVDFPKEFNAVIAACVSFKQAFANTVHKIDNTMDIDRLSLKDIDLINGEFKCTDEYLNSLKEEFSTYTRNENQNKAFQFISQLNESIEGLVKVGFIRKTTLEDLKLRDMGFKFYDSEISIDYEQIRRVR